MLNVPALIATVPASAPYAAYLNEACHRYGMVTWLRRVHFLAQVAHESAGFTRVVENLNYSAVALRSNFGQHRITDAQCEAYGRKQGRPADQVAIGNTIYGGAWGAKQLGNTVYGDGYKYRGRGLIQTTGKFNYSLVSTRLFQSDMLVLQPQLLESPRWAALSAGDIWDYKKCNPLADDDDITAITRKINGGTNGLVSKNSKNWPGSRGYWLEKFKLEL